MTHSILCRTFPSESPYLRTHRRWNALIRSNASLVGLAAPRTQNAAVSSASISTGKGCATDLIGECAAGDAFPTVYCDETANQGRTAMGLFLTFDPPTGPMRV